MSADVDTVPVSVSDVSIQLTHAHDDDGEYCAFTSVNATILVKGSHAGHISGILVDRARIPERRFLSAMDGHSAELQFAAVSLYEPRLGRTKLHSLKEWDDALEFLYISEVYVKKAYTQNDDDSVSNVGTFALRQFLQHSFLEDRHVATAVHEFGGYEDPTAMRANANHFLRNGFFIDDALARSSDPPMFLVASRGHWARPLVSHADAAAAAIAVCAPPSSSTTSPSLSPPAGKDEEIMRATMRRCAATGSDGAGEDGVCASYTKDILRLKAEGGSLYQSHSIHVAIRNNRPDIVKCILVLDPSTLESKDSYDATPLMAAAVSAAGRSTIEGMPSDQSVLDLLLAAGAWKGATNDIGMTAYGMLKLEVQENAESTTAMSGLATPCGSHSLPGLSALERKLMPPGGPTAADVSGGVTESGFIDYKAEDADADVVWMESDRDGEEKYDDYY